MEHKKEQQILLEFFISQKIQLQLTRQQFTCHIVDSLLKESGVAGLDGFGELEMVNVTSQEDPDQHG